MAGYAAIAATTNAVVRLLETAATTADWRDGSSPLTVDFAPASVDVLQNPPQGPKVTLYLYRVTLSSVRRHIGPRVAPDGTRYKPSIPLDLFYLLTAWASDPLLQQQLLGWCVSVLEETPVLPAALLNGYRGGEEIFHVDETVELVWQPLPLVDLSQIWEIAKTSQQPSASYIARMVQLDSTVPLDEYPLVQTREFDFAEAES